MYSIRAEHGRVKYGVQDLVFDTDTDFQSYAKRLNTKIAVGSTAFIIESSVRYMLNNERKWVKVLPGCGAASGSGSSSGGGTSGGDDIIYDGGDNDTSEDDNVIDLEVVYDGGDQDNKD